ncbi:MAG TPA: tetratricopeptide repeat protein [Firmicutes bacterium]|nr:tetratricopeptide repeat protein [Bacillota bacterium]
MQKRTILFAVMFGFALVLGAPIGLVAADADWLLEAETLFAARHDMANVQRSIELLRQVIEREPSNAEAYWRLARSLRWVAEKSTVNRLQKYEEAMKAAEKAAELNPNNADVQFWLAACIGSWGEERGVLQSLFAVKPIKEALDRALEIDPNYADAYYVLSQLYRKAPGRPLSIGNKKLALEAAQKAVRLEPDNTSFVLELAEAQLANNMKAEAKKNLELVLSMPPTPDEPVESSEDKEYARQLLAKLK